MSQSFDRPWYDDNDDDESPTAGWAAHRSGQQADDYSNLLYDRSGQPYGTTPTPEIVDGFVSPDIRVTVDDEMDASPGRVTVEVHVPSMPWSLEQEMDEILARCREAEAQSSIGPWSQAHTASASSTARRPDMVYFLTMQEQRVALAVPAVPSSEPEPCTPPPPSWSFPPLSSPRKRVNTGYVLNCHCSRQEARIEEEVSQQLHADGSPSRPKIEEVAEQPKNWASPHFLERLRPEACTWSPLRSRTSSPVKVTPGVTTSTWMGSEPPGTASSATNSEAIPQALETCPTSPKKIRGRLEPPAAQVWRRRNSSKPREVLIFPMKEQLGVRKPMSPVTRPKGKVLWLPPLRQVPAPYASVLPLERRNRGGFIADGTVSQVEDSQVTSVGSVSNAASSLSPEMSK